MPQWHEFTESDELQLVEAGTYEPRARLFREITKPRLVSLADSAREDKLLAKEQQAHQSAHAGLLALHRLIRDRQHNIARINGMRSRSLARLHFGFIRRRCTQPALHEARDMLSAIRGSMKQNICGWIGIFVAVTAAVPLLVGPKLIAAVLLSTLYPLIAFVFFLVLCLCAELTTTVLSMVLTANPLLLVSFWMLRCVQFKGDRPEDFATALNESYKRSSMTMGKGGFLGEWQLFLARPFVCSPRNSPQDVVINIYAWRAWKAYGFLWHVLIGVGLVLLDAFVLHADVSAFWAEAIWPSYLAVWTVVSLSIVKQIFEEQLVLFRTANLFEEQLYDRFSSLWRDLGKFSVTYEGQRCKLRDAIQKFAADEQRSAVTLGRFTANTLVTACGIDAALGIFPYLGVPDLEIWAGMSRGVDAIIEEFEANGTDVDRECLNYCLHLPAGSSDEVFQNGMKRDCDQHGRLLPERMRPSGEPMNLADFVEHPNSQRAQLLTAHVLALRKPITAVLEHASCSRPMPATYARMNYSGAGLYTTAAFRSLNDPLRKGQRPHPLPITVAFLTDGVRRLRAVSAAQQDANCRMDFWRGMRNVELDDQLPDGFSAQGGTEQAPMSTTRDFHVALRYSAGVRTRLLFKVATDGFMERGADVQYLSTFPAEAEFLYPPLTYLKPTGEIERVEVEMNVGLVGMKTASKVTFTVIEVAPHFAS